MIALLLPFLPWILTAIGLGGAFGANWWFDVTDWQTAVIFGVALIACVYVSSTNSPWARLITVAIIGAALYLKGGVDKEARLTTEHEAEKQRIHAAYKADTDAEVARQLAANAAALNDAAKQKEQQDAELASLQEALARLQSAATKDIRANDPSLSVDAVRRLNAIRMRGSAGS